jgi:hypothetical protein
VVNIVCVVPCGKRPAGELAGACKKPTEQTETLEQANAVSGKPDSGIVIGVQFIPPSIVLYTVAAVAPVLVFTMLMDSR